MNATLLLDLDDTLLENDIDRFLPPYLQAWGREVASLIDPEHFTRRLLAGTQAMTRNRNPDCTLQEAFESVFLPTLGLDEAVFRPLADHFYAEVYPGLQSLTQPVAAAAPLVQALRARGDQIVIATNPLFPLTAIQQRLAWAGLPVEEWPFDLVASYETFHYAKPDPAFFAEALAKLGWPDGPVLVVGDSLEREVIAGRKAGLPVFWLSPDGAPAPDGASAPAAQGRLEDVLPWLESASPDSLLPDFNQPASLLAVLRSTPAAIDSLRRSLPADRWTLRPAPTEWSLTEVLCHLRDVEAEVNLRRVKKVLDETNPFLAGEDTDPWAQERQYIRQDGNHARLAFMSARMELVSMLEGLTPDDWQRTARHAIFGPTRLIELVSIVAAHDRLHVRQAQALA